MSTSDDVEWLLSQIAEGHQFLEFEHLGIERCASASRRAFESASFTAALVDAVERQHAHLVQSPGSIGHLFLPVWNGRIQFARLLESLVSSAFRAFDRFEQMPKRTPSEHASYYAEIERIARRLRDMLRADCLSDGLREDPSDLLEQIQTMAGELRNAPPLSRPRARNASRTYVAKVVIEAVKSRLGKPSYAAAADLVNAVFHLEEPVDAIYMQTLARSIPEDQEVISTGDRP